MANEHIFDDLIAAIHDSVISANQIAENQHISLLEQYFDEQHNPVCMEVNLPFQDPDQPGNILYKPVYIPKLCLIPISSLKMKEIEVSFKVRFTQLMDQSADPDRDGKPKKTKSLFSFHKCFQPVENNLAKVTIKFEGKHPPEGIMRINDHLIQLIP